jgi:hypothetical protein
MLRLALQGYLVLTMRADFWGECAAYPALKEEMQAHQELIAPLEADNLRLAMEQQADHVGLRFDAGLGEVILDDVLGEPGVMPLLQHALLLLWQRRHGRWLRREEYRAIGGIQQAIAHTAEMVYSKLSEYEQERVREIFVRLTRLEDEGILESTRDTRRRVEILELVPVGSDPAITIALIKRLADTRLVVTSLNLASNHEEVEVAHEALIRHWPRLRAWIDEGRDWMRVHEGVRQAALDWQAHQREEGYLLHRSGRLEDASTLSKEAKINFNDLEVAYLRACIELQERERREKEEQQRRELQAAQVLAEEQRARADEQAATSARIRRRALVITVVGAVAVVLAILAGIFYFQAQANLAVSRSRLALLASTLTEKDKELATLLRIEAYPIYDFSQNQQVLFSSNSVESIAWSPDGQLASGQLDGTVMLWNLEWGLPDPILKGHSDAIGSIAWSSDGRLASGSADGTIIVWDLERGQPDLRLEQHSSSVNSVAWSSDGRLASGSADGFTGRGGLTSSGESITSVVWSPDGKLISSSLSGTVTIWDLASGKPDIIRDVTMGDVSPSSLITTMALSQNGKMALGQIDGTIILWDLEKGLPDVTLEEHAGMVDSLAWSPDDRLASGSWDNNVIIWDQESSQPELKLERHSSGVNSVAWSSDGRLASGSADDTIITWEVDIPQVDWETWISQECQRAGRNLTQAEWNVYFQGETYRKTCMNLPPGR